MPSINRPLSGPMMTFDLAEQAESLRQDEAYRRSGRAGRTLAKNGRFRLVLTVMSEGASIGTHQAESPMTLQVVEGGLRFTANGGEHGLHAGQVLFFGPGDAHDIRATETSALLITISATDADFHPEN
jgi:quercetin dioxygenase-like cupin family protein